MSLYFDGDDVPQHRDAGQENAMGFILFPAKSVLYYSSRAELY